MPENKPYQYTELADGTELPMATAYDGDSSIWAWTLEPNSMDMTTAFETFSNANRTARITMHIGDKTETHEGYTKLAAIQTDGRGITQVRLKKG